MSCSARRLHVSDIKDMAIDPDLSASRTVDMRYELGILF